MDAKLDELLARLEGRLGRSAMDAWFRTVACRSYEAGRLVLQAESRFLANRISQDFLVPLS